MNAPLPIDEERRLAALVDFDMLDTPPEAQFDRIARLAARLMDAPIALVSLVDRERQWFKATCGLETRETPREVSFCAHAILQDDVFVVPDASIDPRFSDNPLVTGGPHIRFYAGAPLRTRSGMKLGALCVIDAKPRPGLSEEQRVTLAELAGLVVEIQQSNASQLVNHVHQELLKSLNLQRAVLNNLGYTVISTDVTGRILSFNTTAEKLLGHTAEDVIGVATPILFHEAAELEALSRELATEYGETLANDFEILTFKARNGYSEMSEWTYRAKNGSSVPIDLSITTIRNDAGKATHFVFIGRDITQRKQAYEEKESFVVLAQNSPDFIGMCSLEGRLLFVNRAGRAMIGLEAGADISGLSVMDCVTAENQAKYSGRILSTVRSTGKWVGEIEFRNFQTGGKLDAQMNAFAVRRPGTTEPMYLAAICHDITDRRRAADELELAKNAAVAADRAKSQFLANMSHEIRTPLNAVIGMTDLLLAGNLTATERDYVETIRMSGGTLMNLINDVLDVSKIESGKLDLESSPFDVRDCMEETLDLLAPRAFEKGLKIAYLVEPGSATRFIGDSTRLRQILINLAGNAIKFTERGDVLVRFAATPDAEGEFLLEFSVRDTGIGIPAERMDRLFVPFVQVDSSTTRVYGGTGLGLAISRRLCEAMGGRILVKSAPGIGSTFDFSLRCPGAPPVESGDSKLGLAVQTARKVVVVESSAANQQVLSTLLSAWGSQSRNYGSPAEALSDDSFASDTAILDVGVAGVCGDSIRALRARGCTVVVLLHPLGWRRDGFESCPEDARPDVFLAEPIKPSVLYGALFISSTARQELASRRSRAVAIDRTVAARLPFRILLAEDHPVNQKMAMHLLSHMGYEPDVVGNGREAIEALERQKYDVVFMDMQMPAIDGIEATRRIRQRWPAANGPIIIAMTANASPADRENCLEAGMNDFISKPIIPVDIVRSLEVAARARSTNRERELSAPETWVLPSHLAELSDDDGRKFVAEILRLFVTDTRSHIARLRAAVDMGESEMVVRIGHGLNGGCAQVGATGLARIGARLEASGSHLEDWRPLLEELEGQFEALVCQIRAHPAYQ